MVNVPQEPLEALVVLEAQREGPDGAALNRVRKQPTWSADKNLNLKILGEFSQESPGFSHGEDVNMRYFVVPAMRIPVV